MLKTGLNAWSGRLNQEPSLGQHTLGTAVAAVLLSGFDVVSGLGRSPYPLPVGRSFLVWLASATTLLALAFLFLGLRTAARARVEHRYSIWLLGALDGAVVGYLVIVREPYASIQAAAWMRWLAWAGVVVLAGGLHLTSRRHPVAAWLSAAVTALVTISAMNALAFRELLSLRLALTLTLLACLSRLCAPLLPRIRGTSRTTLIVTLLALLPPLPILRNYVDARYFLFQFSGQSGAVLRSALRAHKRLFVEAETAHRSAPCDAQPRFARKPISSSLSGSLPHADILILSLDALRWDHGFALSPLFPALGAHVRFTRAVTPAPNTKHALPAVLRGVPAREVPFSAEVPEQGVRHDAPPTLAAILSGHGYRAVQIPTQRFFDPRVGLTTGFEIVRANDAHLFPGDPGPRVTSLRAAPVLKRALGVARETDRPLLLWTHLLESHFPYRHGKTRGPATSSGQRVAIRELAREIAAFLPRYRKARGGRPLIVLIFGDHGEEFGEHGGKEHGGTAYAELSRVAFMIAAPTLPPRSIDAPVSTAASVATLLDLLGLEIPPTVSLGSLLPCIAEQRACPELAETQQMKDDGWVSYTGPRYRLVYGPRIDVRMAFDSLRDPYDRTDLLLFHAMPAEELRRFEESVLSYDRDHCAAAPLPTD